MTLLEQRCGYSRPGPWEGRGALLREDLRGEIPQVSAILAANSICHRGRRLGPLDVRAGSDRQAKKAASLYAQ